MANLIECGKPPDTRGGDFERECAEKLAAKLPPEYTVIAHLGLPTKRSNFYDLDIIVASSFCYEILECKWIRPKVEVGEDFIRGTGDFTIDHVFSTLGNKCRVLASRLNKPPFAGIGSVYVVGRVIVPNDTEIIFLDKTHQENCKVISLNECACRLRGQSPTGKTDSSSITRQWKEYKSKYVNPGDRRDGKIGRFRVKKRIDASGDNIAYLAVDEPPCKVDVHLLEIPFPQGVRGKNLEHYLAATTRAMASLRRLRHPLIHCVTGHFFTGSSLVQISDWFHGESLESRFVDAPLSLDDKIVLMSKIIEALTYCHGQNIFHRNLHPVNVLLGSDCNEIQLTGFECVKDSRQGRTALTSELDKRDRRFIPPEELQPGGNVNYRLYDLFQVGVLFYWILEDGRWPFESTYEYATGSGKIEFSAGKSARVQKLISLVNDLLAMNPGNRPDPCERVLAILQSLV